MTAPAEAHPVEPDGYCPVCQLVGCQQRSTAPARPRGTGFADQLARIEAKLNRLLRAGGLDADSGDQQ